MLLSVMRKLLVILLLSLIPNICFGAVTFSTDDADCVTLGGVNTFDPGTGDLAMGCWFKTGDTSGWGEVGWIMFWGGGADASGAWGLYGMCVNTNGTVTTYCTFPPCAWEDDWAIATTAGTYDDDVWHFASIHWDYSTHTVYLRVDSETVSDTSVNAAAAPTDQSGANKMRAGNRIDGTGNENFEGGEIMGCYCWVGYELTEANHDEICAGLTLSPYDHIGASASVRDFWPLDDVPDGTTINAKSFVGWYGNGGTGVDADSDSYGDSQDKLNYLPSMLTGW